MGTNIGYPRIDLHDRTASVGHVEAVTGAATVQHADGTTAPLEAGSPVRQRDLIVTQPGAKLALVLVDKTAFALGGGGQMRLDALEYDPSARDGTLTVSVLKGSFAFATGEIAATHSDAMTVRTPVGTIAVRGTTVAGTVDPGADSSFSALPDASGAPSVVAFTNGAGTQLVTDNTSISVQGFFTPPGAPVQLAALGGAGELLALATGIGAVLGPSGDPGSISSAPPTSPNTDPSAAGTPHIVVSSDAPPLAPGALGGAADGVLPITDTPPAPSPTSSAGHPHLDNEPDALGSHHGGVGPSHDSGRLFIGTLHHDVFHGTRGPDLFDFVTVPNSLQSGDSIDGRGGLDTLTAAFDAPFAIDHTLAVTNVPLVDITLPGGTNAFEATGLSRVDTLTLHGSGDISLTGGTGIAALIVTDAGHHDTLGGFAQITYESLGDPSGLHPDSVDLIAVASGGTRIDFLGNHPGDALVVQDPAEVSVTVSGAEQITSEGDCHFTVTGTPDRDLEITLGGNHSTVTFDTAAPVTALISGTSHVIGLFTVVGSPFNDAITTTDDGTYAIFGGGGSDTVLLGGIDSNGVSVDGISAVDIVPGRHPIGSFVEATNWTETASFDLGGTGRLTLIASHPTSVEFSGTELVGAVHLAGVSTLELQGAAFSVTFDSTMDFGSRLDFYAFNLHEALHLDASQATGQLDIQAYDSLGSTYVGTRSDVLQYDDSSGPGPQITIDDFSGSAVSGTVRLGSTAIDHFTNFGTVSWSGEWPNTGSLLIDNAAGISVVDLETGQVAGAGGTANISGLEQVTNLTSSSLELRGWDDDGGSRLGDVNDTLIAGNGGDTLIGYRGSDLLIGGAGADHFLYTSASDSRVLQVVDSPTWYQVQGPDVIENFHDSGANTSVLDMAGVGAATQHLTGDKGTFTTAFSTAFSTAFANDHTGDVDYVTFTLPGATGPDASHTFVHVASGAGYSASTDLIVDLQGAHALTTANFHLHP